MPQQLPDSETNAESFITKLLEVVSSPGTTFEQKVQDILALGCERLDLEFGILSEIDGDRYVVRQVCSREAVLRPGQTFDLSETYCERTVRATEPVGFTVAGGTEWERHPAYRSLQLEAYVGVAVVVDDEVFGTLNFSSRSRRTVQFSDRDFTLVRLMGQWIASELTRRRTEEALTRKARQLERLLEASNRMHTDLSLDHVLQEVTDSARDLLNCRYAALGVLDPERSGLSEFVTSGVSHELRERIGRLPIGKGLLGLLIEDPRPHRVSDLGAHPKSVGFPEHHPPMKSFLGVPIIGRDGPIGNLYFTDKLSAESFSQEDEDTAVGLAVEAALAIENARLVGRLQTLQLVRNRFYAMVNHELRNALTGVYGWAELMLRKAGDDPPRPVVETVESAEYALELLNDLLDLSRFDVDRIEPEVARADAVQIVQDAVAIVQPSARDAGVTIDVVGSDPLPAETDAKRVRQILVNLLRNAVRHSGDDSVTIGVLGDDSTLRFSVVDRGEGISPEQQAIIFDAFARAQTKVGGGTGLGLTLSRRLAKMLGGDITVQSKLGHGARFTATIARHM